jgi:hypothetical protein
MRTYECEKPESQKERAKGGRMKKGKVTTVHESQQWKGRRKWDNSPSKKK